MRAFVVLGGLLGVASCFTSVPDVQPANVHGKFTMYVTNATNGCGFMSFDRASDKPRATDPSVDFSLYQMPGASQVQGQFEGFALIILVPWWGSAQLSGSLDGDRLDMKVQAVNPQTQGNCKFNLEVRAQAKVDSDGNLAEGVVRYRPYNLGSDSDCAPLRNCETTQTFTARRIDDPTPLPDGGT